MREETQTRGFEQSSQAIPDRLFVRKNEVATSKSTFGEMPQQLNTKKGKTVRPSRCWSAEELLGGSEQEPVREMLDREEKKESYNPPKPSLGMEYPKMPLQRKLVSKFPSENTPQIQRMQIKNKVTLRGIEFDGSEWYIKTNKNQTLTMIFKDQKTQHPHLTIPKDPQSDWHITCQQDSHVYFDTKGYINRIDYGLNNKWISLACKWLQYFTGIQNKYWVYLQNFQKTWENDDKEKERVNAVEKYLLENVGFNQYYGGSLGNPKNRIGCYPSMTVAVLKKLPKQDRDWWIKYITTGIFDF